MEGKNDIDDEENQRINMEPDSLAITETDVLLPEKKAIELERTYGSYKDYQKDQLFLISVRNET